MGDRGVVEPPEGLNPLWLPRLRAGAREVEQSEAFVFCPECAEREFGEG
jgi:hypothetical protein